MSFLARNSGDRQHDEVLEEEIEARGKVLDKPVAEMRFKEATNILRVLEWRISTCITGSIMRTMSKRSNRSRRG